MNIALFSSSFYPHIGGVEEVTRQLAHYQRKRGSHPLVVTNRWPKSLPAQEVLEELPIRRFPFRVPAFGWKQAAGAALLGPRTLNQICGTLETARIELIHVHCVSSNAYYALRTNERLKLPMVVTLHGELTMDATGLFQRSQFARDVMRDALERADAISAVSASVLHDAEAFFGRELGSRACVIHNGIDPSEIAGQAPYEHPRPYILALGRFVPQKGFDVLLHAYALLRAGGQDEHDLILAGDGGERDRLQLLSGELGIAEHVSFPGHCSRAVTASLFVGCSFFVLPSRMEPLGIVNLEAMIAGKAIVASRVGGVPEIVEQGVTGLFVAPDDPAALAAAMTALCADEGLRETLGRNGRSKAEEHSWTAIGARYDDLYASVSGLGKGPTSGGG